ncbi:MAG: surface-adhesin E family protein [Acidobacteriota bacterium]|nr:surface-adhesin E family protein [Acidobacteriota bacterium]
MKKPNLLATLTLLLMFSVPSFAEWDRVANNEIGTSFYIDVDSIKKGGLGYIYFWNLDDYLKPVYGNLSVKAYVEADCGVPRKVRTLRLLYYKQSMGEGMPIETDNRTGEWVYPSPESGGEIALERVCSFVKDLP